MRSRLSMAALCALACAMLFPGAAARAAVTHKYLSRITEVPAGSGAVLPGPLVRPTAVASDSGELFVDDNPGLGSEYRLDKFDASTGAFVSQFPQVPSLSYLHQGVAVGHATGEAAVYVAGDELGTLNGVVAVFDNAGNLVNVWNGAAAKGAATPSGAFGCFQCEETSSVAADNSGSLSWASGDVYVTDPEHGVVDVFRPEVGGKEPTQLAAQLSGPESGVPFTRPGGLAVNQSNDEVLVVDARSVIDIFKPTALAGKYELAGKLAGTPAGPFGYITGVATDAADGDIYVADGESGIDQFSSAGGFLGRIVGTSISPFTTGAAGAGLGVSSVAVDPVSGKVYIGEVNSSGPNSTLGSVDVFSANLIIPDVTAESASSIKPDSATLNGTINPDEAGPATCQFLWGTSTSFGQVAPCSTPIAEGDSPVAVQSALTGLQPDTTYHYRLQATNGNGNNPGESFQDQEFTTTGPGIHETSASDVAATSATLDATIDPNGASTTYYFQFGTSTGYGSVAPAPPGAAIGSSRGDVEVSQHLQGLTAGSVYHYRVIAVSELGAGEVEMIDGPDEMFTTQTVGGALTLPDNRSWEMVSSPEKQGAQIFAIDQYDAEGGVIQAAAAGNAMTYLTSVPTELEPPGYTNEVQVLSRRGPTGWQSSDIAIPHQSATGVGLQGPEYRFFSEDLSLGVVQPFGGFTPSVSHEASEQTPYLKTDYLNGDVGDPCTVSCYRPLVTGAPGYANVPPGTTFGGETEDRCLRGGEEFVYCGPFFLGATSDASHVVLRSKVGLASTPVQQEGGLYEWSDGLLSLISVLPDHGAAVNNNANFPLLGSGDSSLNARHAISDDGSRIVWTEKASHLYMRDVARGETVQLDAVQGGSGEGNVEPKFQLASSDGSRVFFTDTQHLTEGASGGGTAIGERNSEYDLYECEMVEVVGKLGCKLSDLTPIASGEQAGVLGLVAGAGEDGSRIYFVANGVLAAGAVHGSCLASGPSVGTMCNLYVSQHGVTKLVAVLSGEDTPDWGIQAAGPLPSLAARVSPNGRWFAFMSQRSLTGYDNRDAVSGKLDEEVYLYDAEAEGGTGHLVCASCDPSGARPHGVEGDKLFNGLAAGAFVWSSQWLAANIPGWTPDGAGQARYQSRYLSDSGRLFFNSSDALVPQDVDGTEDVYQYEPPGVGDCESSSASFNERSGGCIGLISSGSSAEESGFVDASANGSDVFFATTAKLSAADVDTAVDIYDAHECSSASPCFAQPPAQPPACDTGDSCKSAPSPQPEIFGSSASATFAGSGNVVSPTSKAAVASKGLTRAQKLARALKACTKKRGRQRARCERKAKARYGAKRASRANAIKRSRG
jgi:hypothetical protein